MNIEEEIQKLLHRIGEKQQAEIVAEAFQQQASAIIPELHDAMVILLEEDNLSLEALNFSILSCWARCFSVLKFENDSLWQYWVCRLDELHELLDRALDDTLSQLYLNKVGIGDFGSAFLQLANQHIDRDAGSRDQLIEQIKLGNTVLFEVMKDFLMEKGSPSLLESLFLYHWVCLDLVFGRKEDLYPFVNSNWQKTFDALHQAFMNADITTKQ